ncbi:hypothetical protein PMI34_04778 [Pseudomonas sp. GM74]|nr:hypothetical protein PMI34_04778 [Pseudomonas sp. GM74]
MLHVYPGAIRVALRSIPYLYCVTDSTAAGVPNGEYKPGNHIVTKCLGSGDNVLQLDCIAMTRIRLQLADGKALSECDLKALGCQGVSQPDGGVWHLLIGDKAPSLSDALEALVNRSEVSAKV